MRPVFSAVLVAILAGCATPATSPDTSTGGPETASERPRPAAQTVPTGAMGTLLTEVRDFEGAPLEAYIELQDAEGRPVYRGETVGGVLELYPLVGSYRAFVHVYNEGLPYLVDIQEVVVGARTPAKLESRLVEWRSEQFRLAELDSDSDLATDMIERIAGTDKQDVTDVPGRRRIAYERVVIEKNARWYRGDLQVHSEYGRGKESVSELIARAERRGLDFLAITDRNTMASMDDPGYHSDKVVLIPGLEWGNDARGVALIYAPGTEPAPPGPTRFATSIRRLVQAQGGIYSIAHPCFSRAPWQWGIGYVNSIQVWCGDWRGEPPMAFSRLDEELKEKTPGELNEKRSLIRPIARAVKSAEQSLAAARSPGMQQSFGVSPRDSRHLVMSANMQAEKFWDFQLMRGMLTGAIGGSDSDSPRKPLGAPVTYVYAAEKSIGAIIEGLRLGRTYVSRGLEGPTLSFRAKFLNQDMSVGFGGGYIGMGGMVPLDTTVQFEAAVSGGKGLKFEVIRGGLPIFTKNIKDNTFEFHWKDHMNHIAAYRIRVVGRPADIKAGYGVREVHALSSPIYVRNVFYEKKVDPNETKQRALVRQ